jgi:hypothetical protein
MRLNASQQKLNDEAHRLFLQLATPPGGLQAIEPITPKPEESL